MTARKPAYLKLELVTTARSLRTSYRCRCSVCERRATFRGKPWLKKKVPACQCGSKNWRIDWFRQLTETTRARCDCGGRHFPHRRGSCGPPQYLATP